MSFALLLDFEAPNPTLPIDRLYQAVRHKCQMIVEPLSCATSLLCGWARGKPLHDVALPPPHTPGTDAHCRRECPDFDQLVQQRP